MAQRFEKRRFTLILDAMTQHIATFYRFAALSRLPLLQARIRHWAESRQLLGTVLLAEEGINASVAGSLESLQGFIDQLAEVDGLADLEYQHHPVPEPPFRRLKVNVRDQIVTMGEARVNAAENRGEYVSPEDWNALLEDEGVRVVDTRNEYEVAAGSFEGAEDPGTGAFREFPEWADQHLDPDRDRRVAMFCTGGIRCEKATAYLRERGFEHVFHLKGGILNYLAQVPAEDSRWQGECFVFDDRISVTADLSPGSLEICPGCRRGLPPGLTQGTAPVDDYIPGVACPDCIDNLSEARRARLEERQKQIRLAEARGDSHLGPKDGGQGTTATNSGR